MLSPDEERRLKAEVDERSRELIAELRAHAEELKVDARYANKDREIFEGWMIQKLAGVQCQILKLVERVSLLWQERS